MDQPRKGPDAKVLLSRIAWLESRLKAIEGQLKNLGAAVEVEGRSTSKHFKMIYQDLSDIDERLWPVIHKVFPGSLQTQRQIGSIIRRGKSDGKNKT